MGIPGCPTWISYAYRKKHVLANIKYEYSTVFRNSALNYSRRLGNGYHAACGGGTTPGDTHRTPFTLHGRVTHGSVIECWTVLSFLQNSEYLEVDH